MFENTGTATVIIEEDTTISLANEKFEELSGYCKEEIEGKKSWTEFVVKQDVERMKEFHELRRKDPASAPTRYEFQFVDKAGEIHDILLTIDMTPGTQKSVASLLDITERKNMETELRHREEKYRLLAENTGDVIFIQDMDHNITYVSPSVKEVSSYSVEEALNLHMDELMTPQSRKRAMQNFQKYVAIAREQEEVSIPLMEYEYIKKDGSTFWGELKVRFLRDGKGRLIGSQGVLRDITARKAAEEKLETLHAWAQKLNRAKKLDDIFEFTLDAMEQTLGFSHASIQLKESHSLELEAYRGFKSFPQELRRLPLDGTGITVKAATTGKTILLNDVTQHPNYLDVSPHLKSELAVPIKIQKELIGILNVESEEVNAFDQRDRRLLEMLAAHVAVAIKELWEKKKRVSLQRLDELRNQFLAMAAHEINTPLTPIKTDLEMLQRGYHGDLTEEQERKITKVLESVDRLDRLVTDFRRISKLRTQQITLDKSEHKLANTIEEAIAQFKYALAEEGILLIKNIQKPLSATYDHGRLMQVIRNLMENAIDYTENRIWIKVWEEGDSVCVAVRDNGPGIPREAQKTIFKPFSRVEEERDRGNRRFGGTGLGLYVCKQIIQAHHGTLHVESTPGEGASFTICLPKHGRA
ncbi:MAG: PAS domain S-box protein [Candidatus Korarchaeota archaeon]|nr:PAS domain S-box protein [Candidatus Korarchaeota archaeon]NIU82677.1 PAS domain S-box protein [Candidatus Thorarchaeota archaeon]NIW13151.1 PAS domain S-box protein [Candidatus Thorarchaeota archaeon]NIW51252.1 PAS domain S-box protein [Candidatus Korarchaeota archaeon]